MAGIAAAGALACAVEFIGGAPHIDNGSSRLFGFTAHGSAIERAVERRVLALPSADRARQIHAWLTAEPHVAGSDRDLALARWVRDQWRDFGLDEVDIVEHDVLLPYATEVLVETTMPARWRASLVEEPIAGDPSTTRDVGLAYHAYSASGDVTAPVVFAGSGDPADYDALAASGVDIAGKIALVRYAVPYSYRGFKAFTAERRRAAGILIYSDPQDDGATRGRVFPDGPWGPESHIQRGGVVYDFLVPGDPLTPGWASVPGAKRIAAAAAVSLPKIVSAPLSWKDARVLRDAMSRGPVAVHLRVKNDDRVRPIWTVIGKIRGARDAGETVIVGNHRDAWAYGGVDPSSGTTALMELARALGSLARAGHRPARTIEFASWDAEEFTLTSSTEWGEEHARELAAHAVAYLNVDSAVSGRSFTASAVPSLNRVITEAAGAVVDPETGRSIADAARRGAPRQASALPAAPGADLVSNRLGSGSDYTVFLNFVGVPVADLSFTGPYGVYHSIYDDHLWMARFGDPGFRYHAAMARLWGIVALRLANADVLPLEYGPYAARLAEFYGELRGRAAPAERAAMRPAGEAIDRFAGAARRADERAAAAAASNGADAERRAIDRAAMAAERAFIAPDGLVGRPWYRHLVYAPQPTYAPELLPGIAEAIDAHDPARVGREAARLAAALDRAAAILGRSP